MARDTKVSTSIEANDKPRVMFTPPEQWQGPSGYVYDLPAGMWVTFGDISIHATADDMVAALDDALTQAQAFMDAEEQDG